MSAANSRNRDSGSPESYALGECHDVVNGPSFFGGVGKAPSRQPRLTNP